MTDGGDQQSLEIQQVEVFERSNENSAWVPAGEGTVLWQVRRPPRSPGHARLLPL